MQQLSWSIIQKPLSIIPLTLNYVQPGNTIKSCQHHLHYHRHYWASDSLSFTLTFSIFRVRFKVPLHHICGTLAFLNVCYLICKVEKKNPQHNSPILTSNSFLLHLHRIDFLWLFFYFPLFLTHFSGARYFLPDPEQSVYPFCMSSGIFLNMALFCAENCITVLEGKHLKADCLLDSVYRFCAER